MSCVAGERTVRKSYKAGHVSSYETKRENVIKKTESKIV